MAKLYVQYSCLNFVAVPTNFSLVNQSGPFELAYLQLSFMFSFRTLLNIGVTWDHDASSG